MCQALSAARARGGGGMRQAEEASEINRRNRTIEVLAGQQSTRGMQGCCWHRSNALHQVSHRHLSPYGLAAEQTYNGATKGSGCAIVSLFSR
jgi:hypothetical protein